MFLKLIKKFAQTVMQGSLINARLFKKVSKNFREFSSWTKPSKHDDTSNIFLVDWTYRSQRLLCANIIQ